MPNAIPKPEDPRLESLIRAVLRRQKLDASWTTTLRGLAAREIGPAALHCCHSGCRPCVEELRDYADEVLEAWRDPAAGERLLASAVGRRQRLKRGLRRLARLGRR